MKLSGKVGLMTASGSGIGKGIAVRLAREGAKVVVNDIKPDDGRKTVELIEKEGGEARFFEADVSDAAKVEEMVDFTLARFGRLDILLNNAAVLDFRGSRPIADVPVESWDRAIEVGLRSYFLGCKFAIPAMLKSGGGVIINMSAGAGLQGFHWYAAYCTLKAGIINLTKNIALDYGRQNIRCVAICPGQILTETIAKRFSDPQNPFRKLRLGMTPLGRIGLPEDVANLALFLASDEASYITGAVIPIDGGLSAGRYIENYEEIVSSASAIQMKK